MKAVSSSVSGVMASDAIPSIQPSGDSLPLQVVHELEKLIDGQIRKETRQNMLRSAQVDVMIAIEELTKD
jgi:hypothetical protein